MLEYLWGGPTAYLMNNSLPLKVCGCTTSVYSHSPKKVSFNLEALDMSVIELLKSVADVYMVTKNVLGGEMFYLVQVSNLIPSHLSSWGDTTRVKIVSTSYLHVIRKSSELEPGEDFQKLNQFWLHVCKKKMQPLKSTSSLLISGLLNWN